MDNQVSVSGDGDTRGTRALADILGGAPEAVTEAGEASGPVSLHGRLFARAVLLKISTFLGGDSPGLDVAKHQAHRRRCK
ncbi:MAG TPA: hypothetical protein VMS37_15050 [Verrucomicrobiae bacterium]|nr:hypothetical protein [Verrucomicrobiae bacterium]